MIPSFRAASRHDRVLRLLDQERRILLEGPLADLPRLGAQREALLAEILAEPDDLPEGFVSALRAKAERNRLLILASLEGVKSAETQIARIEAAQGSLRTYSPEGAAVEAAPARVTRDARA